MPSELTSLHPAIQAIVENHRTAILPLTADKSERASNAEPWQSNPPATLFPFARDPEASLCGILLMLGQWNASHNLSQSVAGAEGSYWHAIAHRMEPDSSNANYWFRRVGNHAIFPALRDRAAAILLDLPQRHWRLSTRWDPSRFIEWCDEARQQPASQAQRTAEAIQKAEWQLLFDWCSMPSH